MDFAFHFEIDLIDNFAATWIKRPGAIVISLTDPLLESRTLHLQLS